MKKQILIGKQGNHKVIVEVELKNKPITSGSAITSLLTPIVGNTYKQLSITGSIGNHSFGQIYDSITPEQLDELYVDRKWLIKLIAIWKVMHLNDMNAGSFLQQQYIHFYYDQVKPNDSFDHKQVCSMLKQHHLLIDNETNPDLNVGYEYGTLWLINPLPDSIEDFFNSLQSTPADQIQSAIMDYLLDHKYKWNIKRTDSNPNMFDPSGIQMDHWKVQLIYDNRKFNTFFSTGLGHRNKRNRPVPPKPDEVIECILSDWLSIENYGSWDDWANDMGYDLEFKNNRQSAKIAYTTIQKQSDDAQCFFRSDWSELIELVY